MFSLLRRKEPSELKEFAQLLAQKLVKRYPPDIDNQPEKRPSVNRLTRIVEETADRAVTYKQEHKLGWLGKARLANEFRWALTEEGYTNTFVDFATEALVVYINRSDNSSARLPKK